MIGILSEQITLFPLLFGGVNKKRIQRKMDPSSFIDDNFVSDNGIITKKT